MVQTDPEYTGVWKTVGSTRALVRRAAIGIILALGPYNYPLNETYATIIPALLMGNIVLLKIPTVGGLVHFLTSEFIVCLLGMLDWLVHIRDEFQTGNSYNDECYCFLQNRFSVLPTVEAFSLLPEGTIKFISGSGRSTMPPIMASGDVDGLAFIGGSRAADDLIKEHPNPHRLKVFLQLEANNMGVSRSIFCADDGVWWLVSFLFDP